MSDSMMRTGDSVQGGLSVADKARLEAGMVQNEHGRWVYPPDTSAREAFDRLLASVGVGNDDAVKLLGWFDKVVTK